ncbi:hypothetical protein [Nocardioides sp. YIM 152315]|uniref:hypothetical protein n=1 Tax=Nocardioides sp. YIM 152315 TaxID=3031760 RepID=UPI0023DAB58D|nr:hypothetical protein [Nocardioides sp. YIM 152315]MDF1604105.1 hypothetical protein [Nocardioides sp. YIM 152315]
MAVRPDNRLADGPMTPVVCTTCGAGVEARKSSWEQTSVQWHDDAVQRCLERRASSPGSGPNSAAFPGCQALRESIRAAAVRGELPVQDDDPLPTNPENPEHEVTHA